MIIVGSSAGSIVMLCCIFCGCCICVSKRSDDDLDDLSSPPQSPRYPGDHHARAVAMETWSDTPPNLPQAYPMPAPRDLDKQSTMQRL